VIKQSILQQPLEVLGQMIPAPICMGRFHAKVSPDILFTAVVWSFKSGRVQQLLPEQTQASETALAWQVAQGTTPSMLIESHYSSIGLSCMLELLPLCHRVVQQANVCCRSKNTMEKYAI